jgi:ubiquitin C-terminal hydrolase
MIGLMNIGNSCYANAILQLLINLNLEVKNEKNNKIAKEYKRVVKAFNKIRQSEENEQKYTIRAQAFMKSLKDNFVLGRQHDAHELLLCLIENCGFEDKFKFTTSTEIKKEGEIPSITNWDDNTCLSLSLPLIEVSISQLIANFQNHEIIQTEDGDLYKSDKIKTTPDILVIQLKRWRYSRRKNKTKIEIDRKITINGDKFKLNGMILHDGDVTSGHYIAIINSNENYFHIDDDVVKRISIEKYENFDDPEIYLVSYIKIKKR